MSTKFTKKQKRVAQQDFDKNFSSYKPKIRRVTKQIRVSAKSHTKLKKIAEETKKPISKVADEIISKIL
jgi:hypothetical protein